MDHLSEMHIPKGKDCYTCHWGGCGGKDGRVFKSRQKVLRHLQSHIGHKPFVCGVCNQAFSEAAPLTAHMGRHAQESQLDRDFSFFTLIGMLTLVCKNLLSANIQDVANRLQSLRP